MSKVIYQRRVWLNSLKSSYTGSMVCQITQHITDVSDAVNPKIDYQVTIQFRDCKSQVSFARYINGPTVAKDVAVMVSMIDVLMSVLAKTISTVSEVRTDTPRGALVVPCDTVIDQRWFNRRSWTGTISSHHLRRSDGEWSGGINISDGFSCIHIHADMAYDLNNRKRVQSYLRKLKVMQSELTALKSFLGDLK